VANNLFRATDQRRSARQFNTNLEFEHYKHCDKQHTDGITNPEYHKNPQFRAKVDHQGAEAERLQDSVNSSLKNNVPDNTVLGIVEKSTQKAAKASTEFLHEVNNGIVEAGDNMAKDAFP